MRRYRHRDWKDPFSWFSWAQQGRPNVLFKYQPAGASIGAATPTFTRADASTCATYVDSNGVVQTVAANVLRNSHYIGGVRTTLLEGSRTNALTNSQDLSAGSALNNCTIGADAIAAPDGTTTADKLQEDATINEHSVSRTTVPAVTDNTSQTTSAYVKAAERTWAVFSTVNKAGTISRSWINLSTGAAGTTSGNHTVRIEALGSSWYRVSVTWSSGTGATGMQFAVGASTADNTLSYQGVLNSGIYVWGRMWDVDKSFPSSYIATAGAAVTRAADAFSLPFKAVPQAMTVYVKGVEQGTVLTNSAHLWSIGGAGIARIVQYTATNVYGCFHRSTAGFSESDAAAAPAYGDTVEGRSTLTGGGAPQFGQSVNGATEIVAAAGAANALNATWNATTLYVGSQDGSANPGFFAFQKIVIASGVQSLATMRAL